MSWDRFQRLCDVPVGSAIKVWRSATGEVRIGHEVRGNIAWVQKLAIVKTVRRGIEPNDPTLIAVTCGGPAHLLTEVAPPGPIVEVVPAHHPVCSCCGELWPCTEQRIDAEAAAYAHRLRNTCHHCGKEIGSAWSTSFTVDGERRIYHLAKKYRFGRTLCVDAARAAGAIGV